MVLENGDGMPSLIYIAVYIIPHHSVQTRQGGARQFFFSITLTIIGLCFRKALYTENELRVVGSEYCNILSKK